MLEQREIVIKIYEALLEKGYSPTRQLTGYLISGDPTYITSHNGARALASRLDSTEVLTEIVQRYFDQTIANEKEDNGNG